MSYVLVLVRITTWESARTATVAIKVIYDGNRHETLPSHGCTRSGLLDPDLNADDVQAG